MLQIPLAQNRLGGVVLLAFFLLLLLSVTTGDEINVPHWQTKLCQTIFVVVCIIDALWILGIF